MKDELEFPEVDYLIAIVEENIEALLCSYDFVEKDFVPQAIRDQYDLSRKLLSKLEAWRSDILESGVPIDASH